MLAFHEATQVVDLYGKGKVWLIDKARQERLWQHQQYALFVVLLMKVENVDTLINESDKNANVQMETEFYLKAIKLIL